MSHTKAERAVLELVGAGAISPTKVRATLEKRFPSLDVRNAIWTLLDSGEVEPNVALKLVIRS